MLLCVTTISTSAKNSQRITCERDIMTSKLKKSFSYLRRTHYQYISNKEIMQSLRKREKGNGTRFVCYNSPSFSSPLPHYRADSFSRQGTRTIRHKKQAPQELSLPQRSRFSMNTLRISQGAQRVGTCPATGCSHSFILHRSSFAHLNLLPQFHHGHASTVRTFPSLL